MKEHLDDDGDISLEQSQRDLQAEPPLSPWSSTADPEEMLSDYSETFISTEMDGNIDDGREASLSTGHNDTDLSDYWTLNYGTEQEEEGFGSDNALSPNTFASDTEDSNSFQDFILDSSDPIPKWSITRGRNFRATSGPTGSVEEIGGPRAPARPVGLGLSTNDYRLQAPSIIVSNNAGDGAAYGSSYDLSTSSNDVDLLTSQIKLGGDATRVSYQRTMALLRSAHVGAPDNSCLNNYEMATQDRQPPYILGRVESHSEKMAMDSSSAFNVDADSVAAAAARTDPNLLHVKRPRLSRTHPAFQTPMNDLSVSQHCQKPTRKRPASITVHSNLQVPRYPTPPRSFSGLPTQLHVDNVHTKDDFLPTQPTPYTPSSINPIEPRTPVSLMSSTPPATSDDLTLCQECQKPFGGTPTNQKNSLQRHIRDKHKGKARLPCLVQGCAVTIAPGRKDNQVKHVRTFHPECPLLIPTKKRKRKADSV